MQPLPSDPLSRPTTPSSLPLAQQIALLLVRESAEPLGTQFLSELRCVFSRKQGLATTDILVMRAPADLDAFEAEMRKLLKAPKPHPLELIVVGGGDEVVARLKGARPRLLPKATGLVHVADDLTLWAHSSLLARKLLEPVHEKLTHHAFDLDAWAKLEQATRAERAKVRANQGELHAFITQMRKRRPVATYGIAALIGLVFALQAYVGFDSPPALLRMGALSPARVAQGEWWRLITCTFLHGGFMHVGINVYVLLILGIFLERIIGSVRFVVLYFISGVVGSLGSMFFLGDGFSVGASGAIWGLLGAHAVLAFHKNTLFPAAMVPGARRAAVINLGINVFASFMPHVDMSAHFFGGAAGALLMLSGLMTRGLAHVPADGAKAELPPVHITAPKAMWLAASLGVALSLTALGVGFVQSQPLALRSPMPEVMTPLPSVGIELSLPALLELQPTNASDPDAGPKDMVFGDLLSDAMVIGVLAVEYPEASPVDVEADAAELQRTLQPPEQATQDGPPQRFMQGRNLGLSVNYSYPSGLILELAFLYLPDRLVRVQAYRWPDMGAAPAGSAVRIAKSVRLLRD
ncbi:MAG: rhomboid family intramembrane serine protease [Deltaproteobacteria bacterium]|nr:rhomboid family intramembrane serine protease [Deltaproteobacteria bacterium]